MRIVGGRLKNIRLNAPNKLPVRPTTDMAKEALFNILRNRYDFDQCQILDLFSGTGNISIEFASRNTKNIVSIDQNNQCILWQKEIIKKYNLNAIDLRKADVFKFLASDVNQYDIIFADPPYNLPAAPKISQLVVKKGLLKTDGVLIIEHPAMLDMKTQLGYVETRKYGNSGFSFFNTEI